LALASISAAVTALWLLMNSEITFIVELDPDGGLTARAIGHAIFTQADTAAELRESVRDAVRCHFPDEATRPKIIRLHHIRDELIAA